MGTDFLIKFVSSEDIFIAFKVFAVCSVFFAFYLYEIISEIFEAWCSLSKKEFSDRNKIEYKVGILERIIYIMLIGVGHTYIIIAWFALKALQNPFRFKDLSEDDAQKKYHLVILGNCISLFCGIVGGIVAHIWLQKGS